MNLTVFRSEDGRLRTDFYESGDSKVFVVSEKTVKGVLLTKFNLYGEVLDQIYKRSKDSLVELQNYLGSAEVGINIEDVSDYRRVEVSAVCENCKGTEIKRELDLIHPNLIDIVPVVPIFVCAKCSKKFYSMTSSHLSNLVTKNLDLFESEELKMKEHDEQEFMKTLDEYIIRIFASKRITRMTIQK